MPRGGDPCRQAIKVHSIWCGALKRLMQPRLVGERRVTLHPLLGCADGFGGVQIDLLIFDALSESLHRHVVAPAVGTVP